MSEDYTEGNPVTEARNALDKHMKQVNTTEYDLADGDAMMVTSEDLEEYSATVFRDTEAALRNLQDRLLQEGDYPHLKLPYVHVFLVYNGIMQVATTCVRFEGDMAASSFDTALLNVGGIPGENTLKHQLSSAEETAAEAIARLGGADVESETIRD